jgi:hypothetical protein
MSKITRYTLVFCGAMLLLWFVASVGFVTKLYWLDPLHFLKHDSDFNCIHDTYDLIILAAVVAASAGLFFEMRRVRKARAIETGMYVLLLLLLFWTTGFLLLWFTAGVGFLCGGG